MRLRNLPIYFMPEDGTGNPAPAVEQPTTWYGKAGVAEEHHAFLRDKQFADINTVLASHRSLEGLMGRNRLAIPNNAEDTTAYDAIYKTLGRPDKAEYKLKEGIQFEETAWKGFQPVAHKLGLSQAQMDGIADWYYGEGTARETAKTTEKTNAETAQVAALEKEWGSALRANTDIAARAFRHLGLDEDTVNKMQDTLGYDKTMKLFHKIGKGLSEDALHQDDNKGGKTSSESITTLEGKIAGLLKDKDFKDRYNNQHPKIRNAAIEEMEKLQKDLAELKAKQA